MKKTKILFILFALIFTSNSANAAYEMNDIETLGGLNSSAFAVSYDGKIVVGKSGTFTNSGDPSNSNLTSKTLTQPYTGFIYNQDDDSMTSTGTLPGGVLSSARGVSGDGSTVVGSSYINNNYYHPFAYSTANDTISDIDAAGGNFFNFANAASFDGSVIVGRKYFTEDNAYQAFKYSAADGMVKLGLNGKAGSEATAISRDGSIIAGKLYEVGLIDPNKTFGFIYKDSVMQTIESTIVENQYSQATGLSGDGSVMVGFVTNGDANNLGFRAFQYKDSVMTDLGTIRGGDHAKAYGVSGDGKLIVGESDTEIHGVTRAFLYNTTNSVMTDLGTLGGTSSSAKAISGDGKFIVGESQITGDAAFHAFIVPLGNSGGFGEGVNLVDLNNSINSVAIDAGKTRTLVNYSNAMLNFNLDQDAKLFGKRNIHIALGSRYTQVNSYSFESVAATLKLAYLFNSHFRAGIFLDQGLDKTMPENYSTKRSAPGRTIFATLSENQQDLGWQLHFSLSDDSNSLNIKRTKLENTEDGRGRTRLESKGSLIEIAHGFNFKDKIKLQPYLGLRHTEVRRLGYQEGDDLAFFPISYEAMTRKSKTTLLGLRLSSKIKEDLELRASVGLERDINARFDNFAGDIRYIGNFNFDSGKIRKNRQNVSVGISKKITANQEVGFDFYRNQQSLNNGTANIFYLHYSLGL